MKTLPFDFEQYPQYAILYIIRFHADYYEYSISEYIATKLQRFLETQPDYYFRRETLNFVKPTRETNHD